MGNGAMQGLPRQNRCGLNAVAAIGLALCSMVAGAHSLRDAVVDFGYRPDSPQADAFVATFHAATIAVHPTIVRRATRTAHDFDSRSRAIALLESHGIAAVPGSTRVDLGAFIGQAQWNVFQADLRHVADAVRGRRPDARYHLVLEFLLPRSDGEIFGIESYVVDQQGDNVFSFLLNAHHRSFVEARLQAEDSSEAARTRMHARATELAITALKAQVDRYQARIHRAAARRAALAAGDYEEVVFDDFEAAVPVTADAHGVPLGFITLTDGISHIDVATIDTHPPRPGAVRGNHVLRLDMNVEQWAAFAHFFYFADTGAVLWSAYDWRAFDGIAFWWHGQNRRAEIFVDLLDNRNRGATSDDAERFDYTFTDDFTGWRRMAIPFDAFVRKEVSNGAPNDGLGLSSVHGWAIGATGTDGPVTYFVDDFSLQHVGPASHDAMTAEAGAGYPINELPMYGLAEKTAAQKRADDEYIDRMTRGGRSRQAAALIAAKNAWNVFYSGDKPMAIKRFNQAWLLDPDNQLALWGFAVTCVDRGQYDEAARFYRLAIDSGPSNPGLERDYRLTLRKIEKMRPRTAVNPDR